MEEKRKDSVGTPPPLPTPPSTTSMDAQASEQPASSRRRGGGVKRKSASVNSGGGGGGNSSASLGTSFKRQAREKLPVVLFPPIHTNRPCTRARVHPHSSSSFYRANPVKSEGDAMDDVGKGDDSSELSEALEAKIEAEFEAIRSRDANVHVVPVHAGWFMWTEIHPLEQKMLPSFFNGKSETRNADVYIAIRNSLMKKFHNNPNEQIDVKYLSELTVGDLDARQQVMEFLDYWGLINYHPFPPTEPVATDIDADVNKGEASEMGSLVNKLFQFETMDSWMPVTPRTSNLEIPATPSGLFPEAIVTDELLKPDGPSVEYHCNSCSTDCSRKRYHCQKQADFDLCADCFNNGKFDSDMSPSDFILMESTEAAGTSGGNWTDQETLLLLEAIELFRDNWSEIAEHVATKTKAQCILHFVQMPIEDAFFSQEDGNDDAHKENTIPSSISTEDSTQKADPDCDTSLKDIPDDAAEEKTGASENHESDPTETSNLDEIKESNDCLEVGENFVLKALKEAFEAVDSFSAPGETISFADAGNPVMALAAFLVRLLDPNVVTAAVHSLLKFTSRNYSSEELAARHCFPLEDPPDDKKNHSNSEGAPSVTTEHEGQKDGDLHSEKHQVAPNSVDERTSSHDLDGVRKESSSTEQGKTRPGSQGRKTAASSRSKPTKRSAKKAKAAATSEAAQLASENESVKLDPPNSSAAKDVKKVSASPAADPQPVSSELENGASAGYSSQNEPPRDEDMASISEKKPATDPPANLKHNAGDGEAKEGDSGNMSDLVTKNDFDLVKLKRAAVTALSAAAVKAKLLVEQEEDQILRLSAFLVEKQLYKLETKLAFLHEIDNIVLRGKEQIDKLKVKVLHERAQIVASRMGNRTNPQGMPQHRPVPNFPNPAMMRPSIGMNFPRPPLSRPMTPMMNPTSFTNTSSILSSSVHHNVQ